MVIIPLGRSQQRDEVLNGSLPLPDPVHPSFQPSVRFLALTRQLVLSLLAETLLLVCLSILNMLVHHVQLPPRLLVLHLLAELREHLHRLCKFCFQLLDLIEQYFILPLNQVFKLLHTRRPALHSMQKIILRVSLRLLDCSFKSVFLLLHEFHGLVHGLHQGMRLIRSFLNLLELHLKPADLKLQLGLDARCILLRHGGQTFHPNSGGVSPLLRLRFEVLDLGLQAPKFIGKLLLLLFKLSDFQIFLLLSSVNHGGLPPHGRLRHTPVKSDFVGQVFERCPQLILDVLRHRLFLCRPQSKLVHHQIHIHQHSNLLLSSVHLPVGLPDLLLPFSDLSVEYR
mmetsp:Transcript_33724/g.73716  ORF Transcript_33724/g.73716 Transcript_33724/m.73716 type:complete len:340 (+) Transcript_33724:274-1293(+)